MKKSILVSFLFFVIIQSVFSQTINDIPVEKLDGEYITVRRSVTANSDFAIGSRVLEGIHGYGNLVVEFGDGSYMTNARKERANEAVLTDEKGNKIRFSSATQAVSFLTKYGYDMIDINITPYGESSLMYSYLMAKKIVPSSN